MAQLTVKDISVRIPSPESKLSCMPYLTVTLSDGWQESIAVDRGMPIQEMIMQLSLLQRRLSTHDTKEVADAC